jgi:hypothetical protein
MPERQLLASLSEYRTRFRAAGLSASLMLGAATAGLVLGSAAFIPDAWNAARLAAIAVMAVVGIGLSLRAWRHWTLPRVAAALERLAPLDNLIITSEEVISQRSRIERDAIRNDVFAGALDRLSRLDAKRVQPLAGWMAAAALSVLAIVVLLAVPQSPSLQAAGTTPGNAAASAPLAPGDLRVTVQPPGYTQQSPVTSLNPTSLDALEGSRVRLELAVGPATAASSVSLRGLDGSVEPFTVTDGQASFEIVAAGSRPLLIRQTDRDGQSADRLVHLRVNRDEPAVVAIREPAKDLVFPEGRGEVPLRIEARDDVALRELALRYTKVSGTGETFTFEEGEWPVTITREGVASWRGQAVLSLASLKLQDGDTLVYRAIARDGKPGADPTASDSYLIEIGSLTGIAAQGFALPEERDRHAISQQMVIVKTERLHAARHRMSDSDFLEQSQLLAVEQRMVQSEFVFMTGGHVHDEVEEAEQSHDIAEGRLENSATAEMMNAIREMARAETRLNAADTAQALVHERAALQALQRAFDRRRYFLRTLPERARIDVSRRLTGELDNARSSSATPNKPLPDPLRLAARGLLEELSRARPDREEMAAVAARLLALQPDSDDLQRAATRLMSAKDDAGRLAAIHEAQRAIVGVLRVGNPPSELLPLDRDGATGRLVEELRRQGSSK